MVPNPMRFLRHNRAVLVLAVALGVTVWGGCSDDKNPVTPPGGSTTSFIGVFANGNENGSIAVVVNSLSLSPRPAAPFRALAAGSRNAPLASVGAAGTLRLVGGGSIGLAGTYDNVADTLHLSNSGAGYTFSGALDTTGIFTAITGQYTGPNGPGFFGCVTGISVAGSYCGTFVSDSTGGTGNWDILIAGGEAAGIAVPDIGEPFAFEGTIETTGTMRAITAGNGSPGEYQLTVTGTLNTTTNTVSGTWTYEDLVTPSTDSGTWSGSLCP